MKGGGGWRGRSTTRTRRGGSSTRAAAEMESGKELKGSGNDNGGKRGKRNKPSQKKRIFLMSSCCRHLIPSQPYVQHTDEHPYSQCRWRLEEIRIIDFWSFWLFLIVQEWHKCNFNEHVFWLPQRSKMCSKQLPRGTTHPKQVNSRTKLTSFIVILRI